MTDSLLTPPTSPSHDTESETEYAIYFPDRHPSLFVSFLGSGHQGAAMLVRSVLNGKLYVRKRQDEDHSCPSLEANNDFKRALCHPNIPRLLSRTSLAGSIDRAGTADLYSFCNGRDLGHLIAAAPEPPGLPPLLIYHLIHTLLSTAIHIHANNIAHGDIIPDNVFVHWPDPSNDPAESSLESYLPEFFLGDFGVAYSLPPNATAQEQHVLRDTPQAVQRDLKGIASTVAYAINGKNFNDLTVQPEARERLRDEDPALLRAYDTLVDLPRVLQRYGAWRTCDGAMFTRIVGAYLKDLERAMQSELTNMESAEALLTQLRSLRPGIADADRVPYMVSEPALLTEACFQPPGPWSVAEVDNREISAPLESSTVQAAPCPDANTAFYRSTSATPAPASFPAAPHYASSYPSSQSTDEGGTTPRPQRQGTKHGRPVDEEDETPSKRPRLQDHRLIRQLYIPKYHVDMLSLDTPSLLLRLQNHFLRSAAAWEVYVGYDFGRRSGGSGGELQGIHEKKVAEGALLGTTKEDKAIKLLPTLINEKLLREAKLFKKNSHKLRSGACYRHMLLTMNMLFETSALPYTFHNVFLESIYRCAG
ncbi:uncharacterized protein AB675_5700 [Cyphellophora attinorum]|uniref:Protein kinase domain-containing protein n=1 Tax=Cyphellophora attinorum TaxID=1664694 RepID=A0A0N1HCV7_9EURO|nr:uncharacterized protein AB675_5700 [Phialophora attinorum]KPI41862.1 hypothetical protein AB675_5700 [Phialophora attinorum]